ncbi:MAG: outer membrane protein assembly factor BamE precursor [Pseudomonadota bacterium]|jgi:outer membrane protein assembly factor BamE
MTAFLTFPLTGQRLAMLLVCVGLAGCGGLSKFNNDTFKPYVPEVVQGNFVSKEQRQALTLGMARAQVREILGTPLVTSLFHADRWDYAFSIRRQGVPQQNFQLTLFFKGDVLQSVEGSELPSESEFVGRLEAKRKGVRVPNLQASEEDLKKFPSQSSSPMDERKAPLPASYPPLEPAPR